MHFLRTGFGQSDATCFPLLLKAGTYHSFNPILLLGVISSQHLMNQYKWWIQLFIYYSWNVHVSFVLLWPWITGIILYINMHIHANFNHTVNNHVGYLLAYTALDFWLKKYMQKHILWFRFYLKDDTRVGYNHEVPQDAPYSVVIYLIRQWYHIPGYQHILNSCFYCFYI